VDTPARRSGASPVGEGQRSAPRVRAAGSGDEQGKPPGGAGLGAGHPPGGSAVYGPLRPLNKGRYRMGHRWFGFRAVGSTSIEPFVNDEFVVSASLNFPEIHDGNTIVRTLFAWRLETELVDNSGGKGLRPWPTWVSLAYSPDPAGDPIGDPNAPGGAKLWREHVGWIAQPWTDGSLFATKWYAQSTPWRSGQGQRIIHDKTVAELSMGWTMTTGEVGIDDTNYVAAAIKGWVQVDFLVAQ